MDGSTLLGKQEPNPAGPEPEKNPSQSSETSPSATDQNSNNQPAGVGDPFADNPKDDEGNKTDPNNPDPQSKTEDPNQKQEEPAGAPEQYVEFTFPDGMQQFKAETMESAKGLFKEMNLSQENAQKLVDLEANHIKEVQQESINQYQKVIEGWEKETMADLGGNWKEELSHAARAIDQFGGQELREILNQTGIGNHKAVVKAFINIGKAISEDVAVNGTKTSAPKSAADVLFGDITPQK